MIILFYKTKEILPFVGGIARINYSLKESLVSYGHKCIFMSATRCKDITPDECQLWLPNTIKENSGENIVFLHRFFIKEKIDIIINNEFSENSFQLLDKAKQDTNTKLVSWIHNNILEYSSRYGYRKEMILRHKHMFILYKIITSRLCEKVIRYLAKRKYHKIANLLYDRSDKVVVVSDGNEKEFLDLLGNKDYKKKICPINNFIIPDKNTCSLSEKKQIIIWCGQVDFYLKKTNWMLEIWKEIEPKHPEWNLYILGDSPYLNEMKDYAKEMKLKRTYFLGRVNPISYYREASILCSTSITESFGLTIVEGMQQKVVPIAFASSVSIKDIVKYNGILVTPFNRQEFINKLEELISNKNFREFKAQKCYITSQIYDNTKVILLWLKLFESL